MSFHNLWEPRSLIDVFIQHLNFRWWASSNVSLCLTQKTQLEPLKDVTSVCHILKEAAFIRLLPIKACVLCMWKCSQVSTGSVEEYLSGTMHLQDAYRGPPEQRIWLQTLPPIPESHMEEHHQSGNNWTLLFVLYNDLALLRLRVERKMCQRETLKGNHQTERLEERNSGGMGTALLSSPYPIQGGTKALPA